MLPLGATASLPQFPLERVSKEHPTVLQRFLVTVPAVALVRETVQAERLTSDNALLMGRVRCVTAPLSAQGSDRFTRLHPVE